MSILKLRGHTDKMITNSIAGTILKHKKLILLLMLGAGLTTTFQVTTTSEYNNRPFNKSCLVSYKANFYSIIMRIHM